MKPNIIYNNVKNNYSVNESITSLIPVNTGGMPITRLKVSTVSGATNNSDYPKDGSSNVSTYLFPTSVSNKADGTLVAIDDYGPIIRVISNQGISSTLAGKYEIINGTIQYGYADGVSSTARFNNPKAVAFDSKGNIIVADTYNNRIRKVTPNGVVTTIAGDGTVGTNDGVGIVAQFKFLTALWIDKQDNIYVTDSYRVRKISNTGVVTTIAGNIIKGNLNGNGSNAKFKIMRGITGDNLGYLYVSDTENNCIRRIDNLGNVITLTNGIAGTGIVYFQGMIYVADYLENQIKSITQSGITVKVYAGSGIPEFRDGFDTRLLTGAAFYFPEGLSIALDKTIYVADKNSMKIRKVEEFTPFTIFPILPKGLNFNKTTGVISGTPKIISDLKNYTITASNYEGSGITTIAFAVN